ncbi:MAG: AraC family transcriptional regulator [Planctomycetota bacterium]
MGVVTAIFARRVVQAAGSEIDGHAMLRSIGLDPDSGMDVGEMIAADAYYDFLERIAAQMRSGHELPLKVGPLMRLNDYGALGLAWKSAPTTRDSLERVARYCRVWTDTMTYELKDEAGGSLFVLNRAGERRLGMRLSNEATVASATSLIRQTSTPRFRARAVYFQHEAPPSQSAHEVYFGGPVHYGAELDALSIAEEALDRPNRLADDGISDYLVGHLEREVERLQTDHDPIVELVHRTVSDALSDGLPRMATVATRLAMSERTLGRRLADKGLTFKTVVESTQRTLAHNLLRQSRYSLAEVAFLTGFSEQSAFTRAFKRWSGETPKRYRDRAGT